MLVAADFPSQSMNPDPHHPETSHGSHCAQPSAESPRHRPDPTICSENTAGEGTTVGRYLEALFLAGALLVPMVAAQLGRWTFVGDLAITFVAIILEALPLLLAGTLIGGLVEVFVSGDKLRRMLEGRRTLSVFAAAGFGVVFPVCECGIVPVAARFMRKGVPFSAGIAFLLAVPIVNPVVAASTAIAYRFDWSFVIARLVCGYAIAVAAAFLVDLTCRRAGITPLKTQHGDYSCCAAHEHGHASSCGTHEHDHGPAESIRSRLAIGIAHGCEDFFQIGRYFIIGAFLAAVLRTVVDMETFTGFMQVPWIAIVIMMISAVLLNLCSEADAFIAAAFRGLMPAAAQIAFMVYGPMVDLKLLLMYSVVFTKQAVVYLVMTVTALVFVAMMLLHYGAGGVFGAY